MLNTFLGSEKVLALTILFDFGEIKLFPHDHQLASYARLVKCKAVSALAHKIGFILKK
ncbi:transposase [Glaciecola sp. 1036]|uniref:transposase n=1 Tax=Alteromonadaceae TaxID=72275 RepID=UPI003D00F511